MPMTVRSADLDEGPATSVSEARCMAHGWPWVFHGLEPRMWRVADAVSAWLVPHVGDAEGLYYPIWVAIDVGTRLRFDQTGVVEQGCTQADIIVYQQFYVLDGSLKGRCIEFNEYVPSDYMAWVPDGIIPDAPIA